MNSAAICLYSFLSLHLLNGLDEELIFISRRPHKQWAERVSSIFLSVAMAGEPEAFKVMPVLLFWWSCLAFRIFLGVWGSSTYVRGKGSVSHTFY